jgi:hypothetical protein
MLVGARGAAAAFHEFYRPEPLLKHLRSAQEVPIMIAFGGYK